MYSSVGEELTGIPKNVSSSAPVAKSQAYFCFTVSFVQGSMNSFSTSTRFGFELTLISRNFPSPSSSIWTLVPSRLTLISRPSGLKRSSNLEGPFPFRPQPAHCSVSSEFVNDGVVILLNGSFSSAVYFSGTGSDQRFPASSSDHD